MSPIGLSEITLKPLMRFSETGHYFKFCRDLGPNTLFQPKAVYLICNATTINQSYT